MGGLERIKVLRLEPSHAKLKKCLDSERQIPEILAEQVVAIHCDSSSSNTEDRALLRVLGSGFNTE